MKASIITIGDELLIGQVIDTNAAYLAKELDVLGFEILEIHTISDTQKAIAKAMEMQVDLVDLVILTGGLGPTKDDVTKKVFCDFFGDHLVEFPEVLVHVRALLEAFYKRPLSEVNKQQAWLPSKTDVLFNRVGTAPGMLMKSKKTLFVSLPGVPFEMKTIFQEQLVPYIQKKFPRNYNLHKTIITYGIGESLLAAFLEAWESNLEAGVTLAYLPSPGRVRLRLSARGSDFKALENKLQNYIEALPKSVLEYVVSYADEGFEKIIAKKLENHKKTISFAESCTGGNLAQLFAAIPGASAYFRGGIVTYATETKVDVLGVSKNTIEKQSVVSEAVAVEMATNAKKMFKSDYAVATTGNAGPTKGDSAEDVGTVFIGVATPEGVFAKRYNFGQPREKVVQATVSKGLSLIYKEILKK